MSYFGTSGPKSDFNRSIGAGYVRRLNLQAQRNTRGIGSIGQAPLQPSTFSVKKAYDNTIDTQGVNIKDRLNNWYSKNHAGQYGDVNYLRDTVNNWQAFEAEVVVKANIALKVAQEEVAKASFNVTEFANINADIKVETDKVVDGRPEELDAAKVSDLLKQARAISPSYNITNYPKEISRLTSIKSAAIKKRTAAEQDVASSQTKLDSKYIKQTEDFFVSGPLMRESKTALVIAPATLLLGVVAGVYLLNKFTNAGPKKATGNKSAAYAVFA